MNNLKKLSIILLLSLGASGAFAGGSGNGCNTGCNTTNNGCNTGCNTSNNDCGNCSGGMCSTDCNSSCDNQGVSTVFVPRSITTDLTLRNDLTFYNRYHDARCNFFIFDNTFIYQQSRRGRCLGVGLLGSNPITVAQQGGDFNSLNIGLGSDQTGGFSSTFEVRPQRRVFAWLPQFIFNLDCLCTGFWADLSFAVARVHNKIRFCENVTTPGDITGITQTNVTEAFQALNVFSCEKHHTGVDNVLIRVGYDYTYCGNDHAGIYFLGLAPTGRHNNTAQWFAPTVGNKHGGVGVGFEGDWTIYSDDCNNSDLVLMTELKYTFVFKHHENRIFDLNNGPLSRFLLAAPADTPCLPVNITTNLTTCAKVEPRSTIDWWLGLHYNWCNFGVEFDYGLWWRQREKVCASDFNFDSLGIFNQTCGCGTSDSTATIATEFGTGTADPSFVELTAADVNIRSGAAQTAFSNTVSGAVSYSNVWCDQYPWYVGIGGKYEFASRKHRRSTLENWGVFGKATISF